MISIALEILIVILISIEVWWTFTDRRVKYRLSKLYCEICDEAMGKGKRRKSTKDKHFKGHKKCVEAYNARLLG